MKKGDNASRNGIGTLSVLLTIFITLKLVGVIQWPWWMVLIPLWIQIAVVVLAWIVLAIIYIFKEIKK
jgi:uncharacterized membrane protein YesL